MIHEIILFLVGLALIIYCSDKVVEAAVQLASHLEISPLIIGLTAVAFGTSLPELVTALLAIEKGHVEIALGNVLGSNLANIGLVIGVAGITGALLVKKNELRLREAMVVVGLSIIGVVLAADGTLGFVDGTILLALFAAYIAYLTLRAEHEVEDPHMHEHVKPWVKKMAKDARVPVQLLVIIAGGFGLWIGASWVVDGVLALAQTIGISEEVVAFTAVAIGTSLPELTVAIQAARKDEGDLIIGEVLGSNTMNLLLVLGLAAFITPITVSYGAMLLFPLIVIAAALLWIFLRTEHRITRFEGAVLLVGYLATMVFVGWIA